MKLINRNVKYITVAVITLIIGIAAANSFGQDKFQIKEEKIRGKESREFCSNNNWSSNDKVSLSQLRETTVAAGGTLTVDGQQNGGISVKGSDRSDIQIRACVQAWGTTEEAAKALANEVKINTSGTIKAEGPTENGWSVSYQILTPRNTNVNLTAHNGGISITGIDATAQFETMNGGVFLSNVAGNFSGRTTNGGVFVKLSGSSWKGGGLDVKTSNGGVNIEIPENYAAHVETGTVNGGFSSDIAALKVERDDRDRDGWYHQRPTKISTDLNGGGPPVRVVTTNGGVRISTPGSDKD
ncbi:MAG TPA: hypothetical protein VGO43_13340 [Pyrinomonadaceae bacterium]|jgi:hypothetical protein|nr:hypothetical protein [Pyrinomonadaceae bacterium]